MRFRKKHKQNMVFSTEKPQDTKKSFLLFLHLLMTKKANVIICIVANIIGSILYTSIPWFMGRAIDIAVELLRSPSVTMAVIAKAIAPQIILLIVASLLSFLFSYVAERIMAYISEGVAFELRQKLSYKLTKLPLRFYDQTKVGNLLSIATTDIDKISEIIVIGFNQFMLAFFDLVFGVILMFTISTKLTAGVLLVVAVSMVTTYIISKKSQVSFGNNLSTLGKLNGVVEELYSGDMIIKSFNTEERVSQQMDAANQAQYKAHLKSVFMNYVIYPIVRLINHLAFILSAVFGAMMVIRGQISLGEIQAYLQYVNQVSEPMTQFAFVINSFQGALAAIERVYGILDQEEESPEPEHPLTITNPQGEIAFHHVNFGYNEDALLLQDVSFIAKPHQTVAIVGPTGAGKTTLVNLLMRFYEINGGTITLDGNNIQQMTRRDVRALLGMVLQDTWLFKGTVADNIAYGKKGATREEIIAAAKLAQCHYFIRTLPNGYDTVISSDQGILSQGQQQLLTIARVALADPSVLILDEATSSIDTITELRIQEALAKLMHNRTSFIIAHRLSTIRNADMILVMKDGNIIETGSHDELLAQNSFYAKLYRS